VVQLVLY